MLLKMRAIDHNYTVSLMCPTINSKHLLRSLLDIIQNEHSTPQYTSQGPKGSDGVPLEPSRCGKATFEDLPVGLQIESLRKNRISLHLEH